MPDLPGVPHDADDRAIKSAYRKRAMKCHPDRNKSLGAEEKIPGIGKRLRHPARPEEAPDVRRRR